MKLFCVVFLTAVLYQSQPAECFKIRPSQIAPLTVARDVIHAINEAFSSMTQNREKRQSLSPKCLGDIQRFQSHQTCFQDMQILMNLTDSQINSYCSQNCSGILYDIFTDLKNDCGSDIGAGVDQKLLNLILQTCLHGANGHYCVYNWKHAEEIFPQSDIDAYRTCVNDYSQGTNPTGTCDTNCRKPIADITRNFGCCYTALISYQQTDVQGTQLIPVKAFRDCGVTVPSLCTS